MFLETLLLISVGLGANILCTLFIITPLAKNFIQREHLLLASLLPIITGLLAVMVFFTNEDFRPIIIIMYTLAYLFLFYALFKFIKNRVSWKHYAFLIFLAISNAWTLLFNWLVTDGCAFGACI